MKTAIITGITGQDGAYLSQLLLDKGYNVIGLSRRSDKESLRNLAYLDIADKVVIEKCDLLNLAQIKSILNKHQPDELYNLAAQSSVSLSFREPVDSLNFNIISVVNLLEGIRTVKPDIRFYQASSSEMYGAVDSLPITETSLLHPVSPYAISKAAAHWTTINYRESYNLFACCGVLFNHESFLRGQNFFVKKVIRGALDIYSGKQEKLKVGNINIKRDFGYAPKYVEAIFLMLQQDLPRDYIICSGQSVTLREIIYYIFSKLNISCEKIVIDNGLYRPNDIKDIYGDNSHARNDLGWQYELTFFDVLDMLLEEEAANLSLDLK